MNVCGKGLECALWFMSIPLIEAVCAGMLIGSVCFIMHTDKAHALFGFAYVCVCVCVCVCEPLSPCWLHTALQTRTHQASTLSWAPRSWASSEHCWVSH